MKKAKRKYRKRDYMGLVYIAPWLIGFLLLQLYPFVTSFIYSFTDYGFFNEPAFVGLKNYIRLFQYDPEFYNSLKVTIVYTLFTVPGKLAMALFIACLLNRDIKGIGVIRTVYYLPSLFGGSVAVAILWKILFMSDGAINHILSALHLPAVQWLGNKNTELVTICMLEIWQFGSSMVMFLAALKPVPSALYEAASIDGAGPVKKFFSITLPQISPIIFFNLVMQMIGGFMVFSQAMIITDGGPMNKTLVYALYLYRQSFAYYKMGYGCAMAWILLIIIGFFTALVFKSSSAWVFYENELSEKTPKKSKKRKNK